MNHSNSTNTADHFYFFLSEELLCPPSSSHLIEEHSYSLEEIDQWLRLHAPDIVNSPLDASVVVKDSKTLPIESNDSLTGSNSNGPIQNDSSSTESQKVFHSEDATLFPESNKKKRKRSFSEEEIELLQAQLKKPRPKYHRQNKKPYESMMNNFKFK